MRTMRPRAPRRFIASVVSNEQLPATWWWRVQEAEMSQNRYHNHRNWSLLVRWLADPRPGTERLKKRDWLGMALAAGQKGRIPRRFSIQRRARAALNRRHCQISRPGMTLWKHSTCGQRWLSSRYQPRDRLRKSIWPAGMVDHHSALSCRLAASDGDDWGPLIPHMVRILGKKATRQSCSGYLAHRRTHRGV